MSLESGTYVQDLVATNPVGGTDGVAEGDDHLRLLKSVLRTTFPNATKPFRFPAFDAKTGAYPILSTDEGEIITGDATGGAFQFTLPTLTSDDDGWIVGILKIDTGTNDLTVAPPSGTISGEASIVLSGAFELIWFVWSGTAWYSSKGRGYQPITSVTKAATATLTTQEMGRLINFTGLSGDAICNLPTAVAFEGMWLWVRRDDSGQTVTIDANASETINGVTTYSVSDKEAVLLLAVGGDWVILARAFDISSPASLTVAQTFTKTQSFTVQTLTDAASIAWDMAEGNNAQVTLTANRTLAAPSNVVVGSSGFLEVIQDGTGGRTLAFNAAYVGDIARTLGAAAGDRTLYRWDAVASGVIVLTQLYKEGFTSVGNYKEYDLGVVVNGATETQAHGLGKYPSFVQVFYECTTNDGVYAVGDRLQLYGVVRSDGAVFNSLAHSNTTNVIVQHAATGLAGFTASGTQDVLTASSWKIILRVFE